MTIRTLASTVAAAALVAATAASAEVDFSKNFQKFSKIDIFGK